MTTIIICGSRDFTDETTVRAVLSEFPGPSTTVVHGDHEGAEKLAGRIARDLKMEVVAFPEDVKMYGPLATQYQNEDLVQTFDADLAIVFADELNGRLVAFLEKAKAAAVKWKVYKSTGGTT